MTFLIVLIFAGIAVQPAFSASANFPGTNISEEVVESRFQGDPDIVDLLRPIFERMGIEVDELKVVEPVNKKSCRVTIKGTVDGKKINVTITFEGKTCAELLREIM